MLINGNLYNKQIQFRSLPTVSQGWDIAMREINCESTNTTRMVRLLGEEERCHVITRSHHSSNNVSSKHGPMFKGRHHRPPAEVRRQHEQSPPRIVVLSRRQ